MPMMNRKSCRRDIHPNRMGEYIAQVGEHAMAALSGEFVDDLHIAQRGDGGADGRHAQGQVRPDLRHAQQHALRELFGYQLHVPPQVPNAATAGNFPWEDLIGFQGKFLAALFPKSPLWLSSVS